MRTKMLGQRESRITKTLARLKLAAAGGTILLSAACADMQMQTVETVQVDGFSVTVRASQTEPNTWSAFGTTIADRSQITATYLARNVAAIETVSGCKVRPELTTHAVATTLAVVAC